MFPQTFSSSKQTFNYLTQGSVLVKRKKKKMQNSIPNSLYLLLNESEEERNLLLVQFGLAMAMVERPPSAK
jgi:hypothetical protein